MTGSDTVTKQMNRAWRADKSPSEASQAALREVVETGTLSDEARDAVVSELADSIPDALYDHDRDAAKKSSLPTVERRGDGIYLRIPKELFHSQPLGVICRPVHHRVNGEGSAVIADSFPRSETVAEDVMPVEHIVLHIVPTAVWLNRYIGTEGGYAPADDE